jgi:hypothetical protein
MNDGTSLGFFKDSDCISTFRSNVRSALKKKKDKTSQGAPTTFLSTPTQSVAIHPVLLGQKLDNASVSKMSDTASKVATLENRFQQMETQFSSSFTQLEQMLSVLGTNSLAANTTGSSGINTIPVLSSANHPAPNTASGSTQGAVGNGS